MDFGGSFSLTFFFLETGSHVAQTDLELTNYKTKDNFELLILLPPPPIKHRDYRYVPQNPAFTEILRGVFKSFSDI